MLAFLINGGGVDPRIVWNIQMHAASWMEPLEQNHVTLAVVICMGICIIMINYCAC